MALALYHEVTVNAKVQVSAHVLFLSGIGPGPNYQPLVQLLEAGSEAGEREQAAQVAQTASEPSSSGQMRPLLPSFTSHLAP